MINPKTKAIEATRILNMLLLDLIVGTRSLDIFNKILTKKPWGKAEPGMIRMCHYHFLFALDKIVEFYDCYHLIIPVDCKKEYKGIVRQINKKGIVEFRNKYVGHIRNRDTGRPLDVKELETYLTRIYGESEEIFISWINDHKNVFPSTVVSIVEYTRDGIMEKYSVSDEDINTEFKRE